MLYYSIMINSTYLATLEFDLSNHISQTLIEILKYIELIFIIVAITVQK